MNVSEGNQARIAVLETQVKNLDEKIDDIKAEITKLHDCMDRTRDELAEALQEFRQESSDQHRAVSARLGDMEKLKAKWTYLVLGAVAAGGWLLHNPTIMKLLGGE